MKIFEKNSKKMIIAIIIVMLFNFISPITSQASVGEELFKLIADFLLDVSDFVIKFLQNIFVNYDEIQQYTRDTIGWEYDERNQESTDIYYSPGIIFSNTVPGLDANFFEPNNSEIAIKIRTVDPIYSLDKEAYDVYTKGKKIGSEELKKFDRENER